MTDWTAILERAFENDAKGRGDSGDSGDKDSKHLKFRGILPHAAGTTSIDEVVTVVTPEVDVTTVTTAAPDCCAQGEAEILTSIKGDRQSVTTVTTVTTLFRQQEQDPIARLRALTAPDDLSMWHQILKDAIAFVVAGSRRRGRSDGPTRTCLGFIRERPLFGLMPWGWCFL